MNFTELAKKRYSVRKYLPDKVEPEKLNQILTAARIAPTAANKQPQRLLVLQDKDNLDKLKKAVKFFDAPLVIVICSDNDNIWVRPQDGKKMTDIDTSIVTDHMMLKATELGLGTLWMTWFDKKVLQEELNIPNNLEPVNILAIGYATGKASSPDRHDKARKPLTETVFYESFN